MMKRETRLCRRSEKSFNPGEEQTAPSLLRSTTESRSSLPSAPVASLETMPSRNGITGSPG